MLPVQTNSIFIMGVPPAGNLNSRRAERTRASTNFQIPSRLGRGIVGVRPECLLAQPEKLVPCRGRLFELQVAGVLLHVFLELADGLGQRFFVKDRKICTGISAAIFSG